MTNDGPPRHLHPVEPPFDPRYDDDRRAPQDLAAERAVLEVLLAPGNPDGTHPAEVLATELDPTDFYLPQHRLIWETWHQLHQTDGVPPDAVVLNAAIVRTRDTAAIRALTDIVANRALELPNTLLAEAHAKLVRDAARLRAVDEVATGLRQYVNGARADNLEAYLGEALQALDDAVMRFGATPGTLSATGLHDLSWVLTGQAPQIPPPVWCKRADGIGLFYPGKVNGLFGDPEHGKTWVAQAAAVEAINSGRLVTMIDVDHNGADHTAARLALLGARWEHIADPDRFRYYEPEDGDQVLAAVADITRLKPAINILDSLGEIFPLFGVSSNDGDEVTGVMRKTCLSVADAGTCVITIDHLPKSAEARATGFATGSIAKKRMMRGSYIRVEAAVKPVPGKVGRLQLRIEKDTSGELRKACGGGYAGTFVLDSTQPHTTTWSIGGDEAPKNDDGSIRPTHLMEAISRYVEDNDLCNFRAIKEGVSGKDKWIREAIRLLVDEGFMSIVNGARNSQLHHAIALYREAEDDHLNTTP